MRYKPLFIILIFLIHATVWAQVTITGKVINQSDTKPVAGASVFLSNATLGASTTTDGTFSLKNVMPGKYNLVISILGFDETVMPVTIANQDIDLKEITLYPKTVSLNTITVSAKRNDPQWSKNYEKFKMEFLGRTEFAGDCTILNPGVLQFHYDEGKSLLTASSLDFLEIENKALGYKIKYLLKNFVLDNSTVDIKALSYNGFVLFEPLSGTAAQQRQWKKKRVECYEGSLMHFLRAAASDDLNDEGFRVIHVPLKNNNLPDTVIYVDKKTYNHLKEKHLTQVATGPDAQGIYKLIRNNDRLYISFNKYNHFSSSRYTRLTDDGNTIIDFTDADVLFDSNGTLLNPQSIVYDGDWARRAGVAYLLPVDYQDDDNKKTYASSTIRYLAKKLKASADSLKVEKVYLHFDKPYYAIKDTIYFKAYVTGGGNRQQLSTLSGILNVELINPENKVHQMIKLKLDTGLACGDFVLSDSLNSGDYRVRAYTNWMRNGAKEYFFEKTIQVGGYKKQAVSKKIFPGSKKQENKEYDVQFLPEGGTLVTGNYSKIAYKFVAPNGIGIDANGTVADDSGNEVCKFESTHLGMGSFNFVPEPGKKYTVNINFADGGFRAKPLPAAGSGYTLTINTTNVDTISLRVSAAAGAFVSKLNLLAQAGGIVYYAAEIGSASRFFSTRIPKNRFPAGIIQFTLFSDSGEPLNERLVFVEQRDQPKIELTTKHSVYAARQKINIQLNSSNYKGKHSVGSYSAAVINESIVPIDSLNEATILTDLLLTSDLKGNVEQPNYYFIHPTEKTKTDLDNLLLTQGYRHFSWKQMADTAQAKFQPEKSIIISGTVKRNNKPVQGAQVKLFSKAGGMFMLDTVTDVNGKFAFKDLIFADSTKFVVQSKVKKGQDDVTLEIDTTHSPQLKIRQVASNEETTQAAELTTYLASEKQFYDEQKKYGINQHSILLKEVKVEAKKDPPVIPHSQNLNGPGNADYILTAKDIEKMICGRLVDCLDGVYGLSFTKGLPNGALVVDGNFVDRDVFNDLHQDDIEGIEIITFHSHYRAIYGSRMANGGLIITTKRGHKINNYYRYAPGVITYMPKGFYKAREFYSPQYDNPHTNQKMADLRSTIYWNPNIITDKDGKASFSYFNADGKGTYRVVIEGIDADGNLGRQVLRYKVE